MKYSINTYITFTSLLLTLLASPSYAGSGDENKATSSGENEKTAPASQNSPKKPENPAQWFDKLTADNPEWKEISTRNPTDKIVHPQYLQRLLGGVKDIFAPWFEGNEDHPMSYLDYREVLKQQHDELVVGKDGGKPYGGTFRKEHGIDDEPVVPPGQFRHEFSKKSEWAHVLPFRMDAKLKDGEMSDRLKQLIADYKANPATDKMKEPTEVMPTNFEEGPHASIDVIKLPRVGPLKTGVWNKIYANYLYHHYPSHEDKDTILAAMEKVLHELKELPRNKPESAAKAINLIDEYIYLGAHAHPFESANFSLVMAQANYMWSRFGIKGIGSSNIDYVAISEQFPEFQVTLRKKLLAVNPQIASLPMTTQKTPTMSILAHIGQGVGDRHFSEGDLIENKGSSERKRIEGLMIIPSLPKDVSLEYQGHIQLQGLTPWTPARNFLGTTGKYKALEGIAFRLKGTDADKYDVNYLVRLGDSGWLKPCKNGEFCGTTTTGKPMTGLKVWLSQKVKSSNMTFSDSGQNDPRVNDRTISEKPTQAPNSPPNPKDPGNSLTAH